MKAPTALFRALSADFVYTDTYHSQEIQPHSEVICFKRQDIQGIRDRNRASIRNNFQRTQILLINY